MSYNNISQEIQSLCFSASIGQGTYDDVDQWLSCKKPNPDAASSGVVIETLIKYKEPHML
jgi:hypothetical protein